MRKLPVVIALALLALGAGQGAAQPWDVPSFFSPRPGEDIGLYVVDMDGADDLGIVGIWRQEGNLNLGVRAGVLDGDHITLGAEFYGPIRGVQAPVFLSWVVGLGGTFNGATWLRIPAGISVGTIFDAGSLEIMPYVHPRVAFDYISFDAPEGFDDSESDLNFDLDLGADVSLGPQWVFRFGATVGDFDGIGIGIAYRLGRRLVVR
ncbi:MAG TPA: hypothetical protein VHG09_11600 [Longimicrobiales bacterium]|nr:hypothetical protein [Longimicrobiales bacterium]